MDLIVGRAFTSVQLRTILEENPHPFLIVEHNIQLYERARNLASRVAEAMKQASREALMGLELMPLDSSVEQEIDRHIRISHIYSNIYCKIEEHA
jgi:hypothetical protein